MKHLLAVLSLTLCAAKAHAGVAEYNVAASSASAFVVSCATTTTPTTLLASGTRLQSRSFSNLIVNVTTNPVQIGFDSLGVAAPASGLVPGIFTLPTQWSSVTLNVTDAISVYCRSEGTGSSNVQVAVLQ